MTLALPGTVVSQRKRQAYNLVARGYPISKIAKTIGVGEDTVRKYVNERKVELSGVIDKINKEDYAALVLTRFEQTRSEAWSLLERANKPVDVTRALKLVVEIDTREANILQKLGLLEMPTRKEEKEVHATLTIEHVNRDHLDALAAQMLADKMGISPEEALSMCGHSQRALTARERIIMPHADEIEAEVEEAEIVPRTTPLDFD